MLQRCCLVVYFLVNISQHAEGNAHGFSCWCLYFWWRENRNCYTIKKTLLWCYIQLTKTIKTSSLFCPRRRVNVVLLSCTGWVLS